MVKMLIDANVKKGKINKNIYGHFSEHLGKCVYEGIWVGNESPIPNTSGIRNDVIEALKKIKVPVLRWPGGCFADEYHWRDGIGPYESRKKMVNTHWGRVTENNHFGTHEFFKLCELIGAEPYICGNLGSGTVQEMQEWVEYITFDGESPLSNLRKLNGQEMPWRLKYFGIGNENWGFGGFMRPEYYSDLYRRYSCYVRNFGGNEIFKIACGPSDHDYNWTEVLMRECAKHMNGLSLHYYTLPTGDWSKKGSAVEFGEDEWFSTLKRTLYMDELITKHDEIMTKYDPEKNIGLIVDEWGTWYDVEPGTNPGFLYQQNTIRDALVAGINLNIFNNHCDRVQMTNIAQLANVLQTLIITEGDSMILTPTYYVFDMFKVHQDADLVKLDFVGEEYRYGNEAIPQLSASASTKDNELHISLCNLSHTDSLNVECNLTGKSFTNVSGTLLSSSVMNSHNTFENPSEIKPEVFNGAELRDNTLNVTLPAMSVALLKL